MEKINVFKCGLCGNIVEIMHVGGGTLSCCNAPMINLTENTVDASKEKHIPVASKVDGGLMVKVGEIAHPMEDKHYIQWIEVVAGDKITRKYLKPGEKPEAIFNAQDGSFFVREYCNLHGLWKR